MWSLKTYIWIFVAAFTLLMLASRIALVVTSNPKAWEILNIVVYTGFLYALFVFEGLRICAIQLSDADDDAIEDFVRTNISKDQVKQAVSESISTIRRNHEEFMNGRQIGALISIAIITLSVEHMDVKDDNNLFGFFPTNPYYAYMFLSGFLPNFTLFALIPCWLGQMLPELLADRRSISFLQGPLVRLFVKISLLIAATGVDRPVKILFETLLRGSNSAEQIGHGDSAAFERLSAVLGVGIGQRDINVVVSSDSVKVQDTSQLDYTNGRYSQPRSEVRHMIRVPLTPGQQKTWQDAVTKPTAKEIRHTQKSQRVMRQKLLDANNNNEIYQELILHAEAVLETPIPRKDKKIDSMIVEFNYSGNPLPEGVTEGFTFDVTKPTKIVSICIEVVAEQQFIVEPKPRLQMIDDVGAAAEELRDLWPNTYTVAPKTGGKNGWLIAIRFPPISSRITIPLKLSRLS